MKKGDSWNGWKIVDSIGEGNFGSVYRIERSEYGHTYASALKVIRIPRGEAEVASARNEGMDDVSITSYFEGMVEDIVSEFALMSQMKGNSNIVSCEDHSVTRLEDTIGWEICIRMELLTPLFDYVKEHGMTVENAVRMGIDICKALELCQKYHIIHRDIKPENIFYSEQGSFKLGDFGIARELEKTMDGLSRTGTPSYMAPEVFKGQPYNASVDLYSLGIVLYRFLNNNRTPLLPKELEGIRYSDKHEANIRRISGEPLPKPCHAQGFLGDIILKACAYDPKDRYSSPEEMRRDLESLQFSEDDRRILVAEISKDGKAPSASAESFSAAWPDEPEHTPTEETVLLKQSDPGKRALTRRPLFWVIIASVLLIILGSAGFLYHQSHSVPDIVDLHSDAAEILLEDAGLKLEVEKKEYSDVIEKDRIVRQIPEAGKLCEEGQTVYVVLSKGKEQVKVPNVNGMDVDDAKEVLKKAKLKYKIEEIYDETVPVGEVMDQSEEAGDKIDKGTVVILTVCTPPKSTGSNNQKTKNKKKQNDTKEQSTVAGSKSTNNLDSPEPTSGSDIDSETSDGDSGVSSGSDSGDSGGTPSVDSGEGSSGGGSSDSGGDDGGDSGSDEE